MAQQTANLLHAPLVTVAELQTQEKARVQGALYPNICFCGPLCRVRIYACGQRYDHVVNTVIGTVCSLAGFGKPSHLLDHPIAS